MKEVHRIDVHPIKGGAVRVEHHCAGEHPDVHNFERDDRQEFHEHLADVTGMAYDDYGPNENNVDKEGVSA